MRSFRELAAHRSRRSIGPGTELQILVSVSHFPESRIIGKFTRERVVVSENPVLRELALSVDYENIYDDDRCEYRDWEPFPTNGTGCSVGDFGSVR